MASQDWFILLHLVIDQKVRLAAGQAAECRAQMGHCCIPVKAGGLSLLCPSAFCQDLIGQRHQQHACITAGLMSYRLHSPGYVIDPQI